MTSITVACRKTDPLAVGAQKYDNAAGWNVPGGCSPNGVSATRYTRRTSPDLDKLIPLARFLVQHAPTSVAGNLPHVDRDKRVRCYNGKTQADLLRASASGKSADDRDLAEVRIRAYGLEKEPACIEDWRFDIVEPQQSDEDFWNRAAKRMIAQGVVRVQIGASEFAVQEQH